MPCRTIRQGTLLAGSGMTAAVKFSGVSRHFGQVRAVDNVDLEIAEGEFFAMLGPSGSGKTTCLRLIAGFDRPTSGTIEVFGQNMGDVPPYKRAINTVFQDYALFPHLNVIDNVAYGPMIAGRSKPVRYKAAEEALDLVALGGYGHRKPSELSGGQRQRVALARAIINKPKVLLLDEPLGALDLKLREQMQEELKALQRQLGITFVFVTHDQGEALSMADRVAVFNNGGIAQIATPRELYLHPQTPFVADFVGSSNVLPADFVQSLVGSAHPASLRPEAIRIAAKGHAGVVRSVNFLGSTTRLSVQLDATTVTVLCPLSDTSPNVGDTIHLSWDGADMHVMEGAHG
jgi:putative spermidine/putrescine transport system ATP-binding protein